jgi:hypothetical protein
MLVQFFSRTAHRKKLICLASPDVLIGSHIKPLLYNTLKNVPSFPPSPHPLHLAAPARRRDAPG